MLNPPGQVPEYKICIKYFIFGKAFSLTATKTFFQDVLCMMRVRYTSCTFINRFLFIEQITHLIKLFFLNDMCAHVAIIYSFAVIRGSWHDLESFVKEWGSNSDNVCFCYNTIQQTLLIYIYIYIYPKKKVHNTGNYIFK